MLHYERAGSGPPVLLIQGVGAAGAAWRPQLEGLADRYELVAYDNRGVGQSPPPEGPFAVADLAADALDLLDRLGWESAHLVGHSLGGVIAQQVALDAPDRVRSLSLLCTFHKGSDATRFHLRLAWVGARTRIGSAAMRRRAFVQMVSPRSVTDLDAEAAALAAVFERDLADPPGVTDAQLRALSSHDASARLHELGPISTLVVSGAEDLIARPDTGRALAEAIPGARYVEIADAGHAVTIQRASEINRLLAEHLGG